MIRCIILCLIAYNHPPSPKKCILNLLKIFYIMKTAYESRQQVYDNFVNLTKNFKNCFYVKVYNYIQEAIQEAVDEGNFRCLIKAQDIGDIYGEPFIGLSCQVDFEMWLKDMLNSYGYSLDFYPYPNEGYIINWIN